MMGFFAKYLPPSVSTMTFADPTLGKFANAMASGRLHDHLLLFGDPGCGKSYLAKRIVLDRHPTTQLSLVTHEGANWDGKSLTSVGNMMNWEKSQGIKQHYAIVNEVDKLSKGYRDELQAFMDDQLDLKFIMTSNSPQSLSPAFLNRAKARRMDMMPISSVVAVIRQAMGGFGYKISTAEAQQLVIACKGSWRSLEDLVLQQIL